MSSTREDLDAYIAASAQLLGLPIDAAWKPTVRDNLRVIFMHAEKVEDFPLPDEAEPAPVSRA